MSRRRMGAGALALAVGLSMLAGSAGAQGADRCQRISSGFLGCEPAEVRVSHLEHDVMLHTWIASCRGAMFMCVWHEAHQFECAQMRSR